MTAIKAGLFSDENIDAAAKHGEAEFHPPILTEDICKTVTACTDGRVSGLAATHSTCYQKGRHRRSKWKGFRFYLE